MGRFRMICGPNLFRFELYDPKKGKVRIAPNMKWSEFTGKHRRQKGGYRGDESLPSGN